MIPSPVQLPGYYAGDDAPWVAALIGLLTIAANLVGDSVARSLGISIARRRVVR